MAPIPPPAGRDPPGFLRPCPENDAINPWRSSVRSSRKTRECVPRALPYPAGQPPMMSPDSLRPCIIYRTRVFVKDKSSPWAGFLPFPRRTADVCRARPEIAKMGDGAAPFPIRFPRPLRGRARSGGGVSTPDRNTAHFVPPETMVAARTGRRYTGCGPESRKWGWGSPRSAFVPRARRPPRTVRGTAISRGKRHI